MATSSLPLGQITTDILNLDEQVLYRDRKPYLHISKGNAQALLEQKNDSAVFPLQEKLNAVWDVVFDLPFYRDLPMDEWTSRNLFPILFADKEKWMSQLTEGTEGNKMMREFLSRMEYFAESIRNFREQITGMLDFYFEKLPRRNSMAYAEAYASYFTGHEGCRTPFL